MNILPLLTFYFITSHAQLADRDINFEIAQSLLYVIEKFFVPRSSSFVVVLSCERQHTMHFYKDLVDVLFNYCGDIKTQIVVNSETSDPAHSGERIYNLLLVDSAESFLKIKLASKVKDYDINEYYHIFLQNRDEVLPDDIKRILSYCWRNYIINVNIQVQMSSGEILVYTYFPFSKTHCRKAVPVEVNRFRNGTWDNEDLFPQKLQDMHNCPLKVATWEFPPYITLDLSKKGGAAIGGCEGKFLKELGQLMNFEIEIIVPANREQRGALKGNKSTGAIGMLMRRDIDLSLGCFWFAASRTAILTASESYLQASNAAVLLASSANYAPAKLLWFPFRVLASVALLTAFLISFALLRTLTRLLKKWSTIYPVVKRNLTLDFIACTLGLPSSLDARWNSGRIFIMAWMIFSLVIRIEFQAAIYHLIRNNLYRKAPSTIREVMKLNYTMALNPAGYNALKPTSIFEDTGLGVILVDGIYPISAFRYLEERPNEKLLTIAPLNFLLYYIAKYRKIDVLTILQESFLQQSSCIYFPKHSFLADQVNFYIQHMKTAGLLEGWLKKSIDLSAKKTPPVFTIGQRELKGIYYLCGTMLGLSFLVFCLEIMSLRFEFLRKLFRKL